MDAVKIEYRKAVAALLCMIMCMGCLACVLGSNYSAAEEEEEGPAEIDGGYCLNGVNYEIVVENDGSGVGEVYVSGLAETHDKDIVVAGSFSVGEDDDETVFTVTGIFGEVGSHVGAFKDANLDSLVLPTTIKTIGKDAFSGAVIGSKVVLPVIDADAEHFEIPAYEGDGEHGYKLVEKTNYFPDYSASMFEFIKADEGKDVKFYINVYSGNELKATNCGDFEEDDGGYYSEQTIYKNVVNVLTACGFEREYYEFAGWSEIKGDPVAEDNIVADDACDMMYDDCKTTYYAAWTEADPYADYPEWMMWATVGIIVALFVIGMVLVIYRMQQGRSA